MGFCLPDWFRTSLRQKPSEDVNLVVLEEVDVKVDRRVDDGEEVGELCGVLHPKGPNHVLLGQADDNIFCYMLSSSYLASCSLLKLKYVWYPADAVAHNEH